MGSEVPSIILPLTAEKGLSITLAPRAGVLTEPAESFQTRLAGPARKRGVMQHVDTAPPGSQLTSYRHRPSPFTVATCGTPYLFCIGLRCPWARSDFFKQACVCLAFSHAESLVGEQVPGGLGLTLKKRRPVVQRGPQSLEQPQLVALSP